jgi:hypothetical protein
MKKLAISIAAIVAFATSAYASQRGYDLRDTQYWETDGVSKSDVAKPAVEKEGLLVNDHSTGETAFQRTNRISKENDSGRH